MVFVEPIALYQTRDLHEAGDNGWLSSYPAPQQRIPLGEVGVAGTGTDLAIVTYGNGRYLSTQAAKVLDAAGIKTRVIDMRWLAPMPQDTLIAHTRDCAATLVVDECRRTGSQSEALVALFSEAGHRNVSRVTAEDCFIATGPAYAATLPSVDGIVAAAKALCGDGS